MNNGNTKVPRILQAAHHALHAGGNVGIVVAGLKGQPLPGGGVIHGASGDMGSHTLLEQTEKILGEVLARKGNRGLAFSSSKVLQGPILLECFSV